MSPARPRILALDWDARNEDHIEEHIDPCLVEEMLEFGDWLAFPNSEGQPPERIKAIGRTESGLYVTAIIESREDDEPGLWRPITAWFSAENERARFRRARGRQ